MEIGQRLTKNVTFTQADFDQFAILSGDDNPIHVDPDYATKTVFGRPVAHGMFLFSHICAALHQFCPELPLQQQTMMFAAPTFTQEENVLALEVTAVSPPSTQIQTTFTRPDGQRGLVGAAVLGTGPLAHELPELTASPAHKQLQVGQLAQKAKQFSSRDVASYCELVGDENPLWQTAVPYGLLGGMISDLLGTTLPGRGTNWLKQNYTFTGQAAIGEPITAVVQINRLRPQKDLVNLSTTISDVHDNKIVMGDALVLVKELISAEVSMR